MRRACYTLGLMSRVRTFFLVRATVVAAMIAGCGIGSALNAQATRSQVTDPAGDVYPAKPKPLLSLKSLDFLEGTWTAESPGSGGTPIGSYTFVTELNGHVLRRYSTIDVACKDPVSTACAHRDQMYVFQESPGAPLKAIYFDIEGHIVRYDVNLQHVEGAYNRRDTAVLLSEASALGPRFRLSYERNLDTQTGKTSMSGRFETLLANGEWFTNLQWAGLRAR